MTQVANGHNARMYTDDQKAKITAWLAQEVTERANGGGGHWLDHHRWHGPRAGHRVATQQLVGVYVADQLPDREDDELGHHAGQQRLRLPDLPRDRSVAA